MSYTQGGDAKAVSRIAREVYGGFRQMFDAHGWDAAGDKMMISAPALIVEHYGSIGAFEETHRSGRRIDNLLTDEIWNQGYSVLFTSFWGWTPGEWGTVGWTGDSGLTRRTNLLKELSDPFITVCYVTGNKTYIDAGLKGMIAGFYLVSHETGDRDEFTHHTHHGRNPDKWRHSLRAIRAFTYLPEYRISAKDFDPTIMRRARTIAAMGTIIDDTDQIGHLRSIPFEEVDVYTPTKLRFQSNVGSDSRGKVRAGPASAGGYEVPGGSLHLKRELYVLRLDGDTDAYLGRDAEGRFIYKVGLSASPDMRRQSFQKAMPRGAFVWTVARTNTIAGIDKCPSFKAAVAGEDAMKAYLSQKAEWLGGEFYLAYPSDIDEAWKRGHDAITAISGENCR